MAGSGDFINRFKARLIRERQDLDGRTDSRIVDTKLIREHEYGESRESVDYAAGPMPQDDSPDYPSDGLTLPGQFQAPKLVEGTPFTGVAGAGITEITGVTPGLGGHPIHESTGIQPGGNGQVDPDGMDALSGAPTIGLDRIFRQALGSVTFDAPRTTSIFLSQVVPPGETEPGGVPLGLTLLQDEHVPPPEKNECDAEVTFPTCFFMAPCGANTREVECYVTIEPTGDDRMADWTIESPKKQFLFESTREPGTWVHSTKRGLVACNDKAFKVRVKVPPDLKDPKGDEIIVTFDGKKHKKFVPIVAVDFARSSLDVSYPGSLDLILRDSRGEPTDNVELAGLGGAVSARAADPKEGSAKPIILAKGTVYSTNDENCCDDVQFCISQEVHDYSLECTWRALRVQAPKNHFVDVPEKLTVNAGKLGAMPDWPEKREGTIAKYNEPKKHCTTELSKLVNCEGDELEMPDHVQLPWLPMYHKLELPVEDKDGNEVEDKTAEAIFFLETVKYRANFVTVLEVSNQGKECSIEDRQALKWTESSVSVDFGFDWAHREQRREGGRGVQVMLPTLKDDETSWRAKLEGKYDCQDKNPEVQPMKPVSDLRKSRVQSANELAEDVLKQIQEPAKSTDLKYIHGTGEVETIKQD